MSDLIEVFERDIADHELEVIVDSGVNRILEFRNKNGSSNQFFIVMQAKGRICFTGDMGEFVFTNHNEDMLAWFHDNMSLSYIDEKCRAGVTRKYSEDVAKANIRMMVDDYCSDYFYDYIGDDGVVSTSEGSMTEDWADELYEEVIGEIDFENEWTLHQTASDVSIDINNRLHFDIDTSEGINSESYTNSFKWCVLAMNKVAELYFSEKEEFDHAK